MIDPGRGKIAAPGCRIVAPRRRIYGQEGRQDVTQDTAEAQDAIAGAMQCLDAFMTAFNARDLEAWGRTFNYPSVRFASGAMTIIEPGFHTPEMFHRGALAECDHWAWER